MRRIVCALLVVIFLMPFSLMVSATGLDSVVQDEVISVEGEVVILQDAQRHREIDRLLGLRCMLEIDYADNAELIAQIDDQLALLGTETITTAELAEKLGVVASPQVETGSTDDTNWVSRRQYTVYNGITYELQIIEATPKNENSQLRMSKFYVGHEEYGIAYATEKALEVFVTGVAQGVPELVGEFNPYVDVAANLFSAALLLSDVYSTATDAMSSMSEIENVNFICGVGVGVHEKFVFVKYQGNEDFGNQTLCYVGNRVELSVSFMKDRDLIIDGVSYPDWELTTSTETIMSYSYDYCQGVAAINFWKYTHPEMGYGSVYEYYDIRRIEVDVRGRQQEIRIPYVNPNVWYDES